MSELLLSTTGTNTEIVLPDMGQKKFVHPVIDYNLYNEYNEEDIKASQDLQNAISQGWITLTLNGLTIDDVKEVVESRPSRQSIDFDPVNFIPVTDAEHDEDSLLALLKGIDTKLGAIISGSVDVDSQKSKLSEDTTVMVDEWQDIAGDSINQLTEAITASGVNRNYLIEFSGDFQNSQNNKFVCLRFVIDGIPSEASEIEIKHQEYPANISIQDIATLAPAKQVKVQWKIKSGNTNYTITARRGRLIIYGVG